MAGSVGYGFWNEMTDFNGTPVGCHAAGEGWFGMVGGGCDRQVGGRLGDRGLWRLRFWRQLTMAIVSVGAAYLGKSS